MTDSDPTKHDAATAQTEWAHLRAHKFSSDQPPTDWPSGIKPISIEGLSLFGINAKTGRLHWDGEKVETEFSLSARDRFLGMIVAASTASMAIVDLVRFAYGH